MVTVESSALLLSQYCQKPSPLLTPPNYNESSSLSFSRSVFFFSSALVIRYDILGTVCAGVHPTGSGPASLAGAIFVRFGVNPIMETCLGFPEP
mmetsp:Transcript_20381/g.33621  ORF Transcript_20381/g.33621 Transcript_20381/m.33621 type:complete len:94 (-) Transcript_20381:1292-1573(-)